MDPQDLDPEAQCCKERFKLNKYFFQVLLWYVLSTQVSVSREYSQHSRLWWGISVWPSATRGHRYGLDWYLGHQLQGWTPRHHRSDLPRHFGDRSCGENHSKSFRNFRLHGFRNIPVTRLPEFRLHGFRNKIAWYKVKRKAKIKVRRPIIILAIIQSKPVAQLP